MINISSFCGIALCGLAAILILREIRKEWTIWIVLCVMLLVMFFSLELVEKIVTAIRNFSEYYPDVTEYTVILIKGLGIACISYISGEICRTTGESNLAGYVELAGKIELLLLGLPLFQEILDISMELL